MRKNAVVIGAGVNGLVAANVLARGGWQVTMLERKPRVGGACTSETVNVDGKPVDYPLGATVLGMMQDFVLKETGLADRIAIWAPRHPKMVRYPSLRDPVMIWRDPRRLRREFRDKLGERGGVDAFRVDEDKVVAFLQDGFRRGIAPDLASAIDALGAAQAKRWITGSSKDLLDHYFTDDRTKLYMGLTTVESGPVPFDSPMSAFSLPLMDSGSVFGGYWGFVKGGIWKLTEALADIDRALGVRIETCARVERLTSGGVSYHDRDGVLRTAPADEVVFATDPVTAAEFCGGRMVEAMKAKRWRGTSGKVVMVFREPIRWRDATGRPDHAASFKFIFAHDTVAGLDASAQAAAAGDDYVPGYYQVYCEGAGARAMGERPSHDRIVVFFKNLAFNRRGDELDGVREDVVRRVLATIANPGALAWSRLLTPRDLQREFFFPEGNIDHAMLCDGQQYMARTYAAQPSAGFYRFGSAANVWYCGAGAYPCGSVAGTPGWMCAQEMLRIA